ncbi:hypothetical protein AVEN_4318-1 [Araneus ventricosus]|uniref:Uncharacterized protein n=1 Tax=Araneus ventricosus TaxID=182803 RepID=A0A4Y2GG98_ARAVE|nr:hypothetical protein AVEN_4318-1 [Araneus ventricosus]
MAGGDGLQNNASLGLGPQPETKGFETPKSCFEEMEDELKLNRARLALTKKAMRNIKEEIDKYSAILRREMGDNVDIPALARSGGGMGFLARAQEIINLRLKLSALKSQFLEPVHKPYYRGPFDPRKKFDIKLLPQKQENLYCQVIEDEKTALMKQGKPLEALKNQLKDLTLMYRASRYRNKSLKKKIISANNKLQVFKAQTQDNAKTIEYMVSHQNLMKLMLNPDTLEIDESIPRVYSEFQIKKEKDERATDVQKFKTLYEKSEKEIELVKEKVSSLAEILDKNVAVLINAEELCTKNRCDFEILKIPPEEKSTVKNKDKKKTTEETKNKSKEEFDLIIEENNRLRDFLLSSVLSNAEDLKLFLASLKNARREFLQSFEEIKIHGCQNSETSDSSSDDYS